MLTRYGFFSRCKIHNEMLIYKFMSYEFADVVYQFLICNIMHSKYLRKLQQITYMYFLFMVNIFVPDLTT